MSIRHLLPLLLVALAAAPDAHAQHQWRDANGRMVFSDMPPPASVAPRAVQRAPARPAPAVEPGGSGATATAPGASGAPAVAAAAATDGASGALPSPSVVDRELEFRKRRLERIEAERKAAQATDQLRRTAAACEDSRGEIRSLESGMRVTRVNERGEREVVDDAQRAARLEAARRVQREHCAAS